MIIHTEEIKQKEMEEKKNVKLHGFWASPYSKRVELALKAKGIPYEYIEENLYNKTTLLLQYNPVHKKIPVLVHNDKSVVESLVILEYIDETWKDAPKLLPEDPYLRANVRYWANFLHQEIFESMRPVITTHGEAQEKILRDVTEKLKMVEKQMQDLFPGEKPLVDGKNLGLLDIVVFSVLGCFKAAEEAAKVKLIDPEETPFIFSWVTALNELPLVKETIQPHSKMVERFRYARQKALQSIS